MKSNRCLPLVIWVALLASFPLCGYSQSRLFDSEEPLDIVLEFDVGALLADRGGNPVYHPVVVRWGSADSIEAKIQARGRFRRDPLICDWPPLKVNFPKKLAKDTPFERQDVLKLVTRCKEQEAVLREYYIYRMYNLLTERSFRVRLAKITYHDAKGSHPDESSFAFFIEDDDALAKRLNASVDKGDYTNDQMERNHQTLVHLFNFMIANRDFDVMLRQNLAILTDKDSGTPYAVPYDFDWSGLVKASYTANPLSTESLYVQRQRFKPVCRTEEEFQAVLDRLVAAKPAIWKLYQSSDLLTKSDIAETLNLLDSFYKKIKRRKYVVETFVEACR